MQECVCLGVGDQILVADSRDLKSKDTNNMIK